MIELKSFLLLIGLISSTLAVKECLINGQCIADLFDVQEDVTFDGCQQICTLNHECNWFTYHI